MAKARQHLRSAHGRGRCFISHVVSARTAADLDARLGGQITTPFAIEVVVTRSGSRRKQGCASQIEEVARQASGAERRVGAFVAELKRRSAVIQVTDIAVLTVVGDVAVAEGRAERLTTTVVERPTYQASLAFVVRVAGFVQTEPRMTAKLVVDTGVGSTPETRLTRANVVAQLTVFDVGGEHELACLELPHQRRVVIRLVSPVAKHTFTIRRRLQREWGQRIDAGLRPMSVEGEPIFADIGLDTSNAIS